MQRDTYDIVSGCELGPGCVLIMIYSRSVKLELKIPMPLLNQDIILKKSNHQREIKGLFSV